MGGKFTGQNVGSIKKQQGIATPPTSETNIKAYKVYGSEAKGEQHIYVDGEKTMLSDLGDTAYMTDNNRDFGSYKSGRMEEYVFIGSGNERFLSADGGIKPFEPTRVSYSTFKSLQNASGSGFLGSSNYNPATKTIDIFYRNP